MKSRRLFLFSVVCLILFSQFAMGVPSKDRIPRRQRKVSVLADSVRARMEREARLDALEKARVEDSLRLAQIETAARKMQARIALDSMAFVNAKLDSIMRALTYADQVIDEASKYIGRPYRYGANGPSSFDCSGFTSYVYRKFGVELQRSSSGQSKDGIAVKKKQDLAKGDLVLFGSRRSISSIGHVGIVTDVDYENGSFTFIHAASHGGVRTDSSTEQYYKKRYISARRVITDEMTHNLDSIKMDSLANEILKRQLIEVGMIKNAE